MNSWNKLNAIFIYSGMQLSTFVIDNEASTELKSEIEYREIKYQMVPSHIHREDVY